MPTIKSLFLLFTTTALLAAPAQAQRGSLTAHCIIRVKGTSTGITVVTVMPGTAPSYVVHPTNAQLVLQLVLEETYVLTFEHPDCVTKQLYVDTSIPIDERTSDFDFPLLVVLEHPAVPFSYAGPVGFIFYQHGLADFSYSTDHSMVVNARFNERMDELQRTGVDPRSAHRGYTASTTPPTATSRELPSAQEGTVAPMVAHVGPLVHRVVTTKPVERTMAERATPAPVSQPVAVLRQRAAEAPGAAPLDTMSQRIAPLPAVDTALQAMAPERWSTTDLLVEARRITTIIRIRNGAAHSTEYRRVLYTTGAAYFFQDGRSISAYTYTLGKALALDIAMRPGTQTDDQGAFLP